MEELLLGLKRPCWCLLDGAAKNYRGIQERGSATTWLAIAGCDCCGVEKKLSVLKGMMHGGWLAC